MGTRHVLIVDDESDIREVAGVSLGAVGGYEVTTAASGHEGIRKAIAEQPDAILLDVMMPEMDGPTTFGRLQSDPATSQIPVILLTAKVQSADRARFDELGVAAVFSKPFDPMTLSTQVAEALGWS